jgi:hypothetical protein
VTTWLGFAPARRTRAAATPWDPMSTLRAYPHNRRSTACEHRRIRVVRVGAAPAARPDAGSAPGSAARLPSQRRAVQILPYFLRRAPERFAARKEIPARIAFCWTAAAVRPSFLATCPVGVPDFASALRVASSRALHDAPSFGGRRAIIPTPNHPTKGVRGDHTPIQCSCAPSSTIHDMLGRFLSSRFLRDDMLQRRRAHPHTNL